ncbi:hypothetical protein OESDEN_03779 [Oesophagostomum dentatum]|uniref:Uncharacterized protein n=1 Tax=Oesophagostomum dentatum TaxID=61180 RepID=A0A0B1TLH9_OESDE|nr:hypothetical protein OESDEN_03779 [Oesophagostomum dentatum]
MPDDSRVSSSSLHETRQPIPNGKEIPFEIPTRRVPSFKKQHVPPPDPRQSTPTNGQGYSPRVVAHKDGFEPRIPALSVRSSSIRDEHTGKMVTVVRGDDDDFDDSTLTRRNMNDKWREQRRQPPERVRQTSNNVTIITLGDDSVI